MASQLDSPRAWFMYGVATFAYAVAVMQRTSFGVASSVAFERFDAAASAVGLFVGVQLLVYAAMQVPVGVLVDRFGTRLVVGAGAVLMCVGQVDLALSHHLEAAVFARVLVGCGDAMTFTAVLRMLPAWFSPPRIPLLNQLTGLFGQLGQLMSSIPLVAILSIRGWASAFLAAAALSAVAAVVVLATLRDTPPGDSAWSPGVQIPVARQILEVLRRPRTGVGFAIHWMCALWSTVFSLMWGYPFLERGLGYSPTLTGTMFTIMVFAGVPVGPLLGWGSRRYPNHRLELAVVTSLFAVVPWAAVLVWPARAPERLIVVLVIGLAIAGPGSVLGFDVARAGNPPHLLGTASGVVIVGGFAAAFLDILVIGVVLDALGGYTLHAFRWAMATQVAFWAFGVALAVVSESIYRRHPVLGAPRSSAA